MKRQDTHGIIVELLLSPYYMPGTVLGALLILLHLIFTQKGKLRHRKIK